MKEFKVYFWAIIVFLILIFIYQNQQFFFQSTHSFRVNLVLKEYKSPEISSSLMLLICMIFGFFVSYIFTLPSRITSRKKIKLLQKAVDSQLKEISTLNDTLEKAQSGHLKPHPQNMDTHSSYR